MFKKDDILAGHYNLKDVHIPRCRRCAKLRKLLYLTAAVISLGGLAALFGTAHDQTNIRSIIAVTLILIGIGLSLFFLVKDAFATRGHPAWEEARALGFRPGRPPE
jgi:hypothetical protein